MRDRLRKHFRTTGATYHAVAEQAGVSRDEVIAQTRGRAPTSPEVVRAAEVVAGEAIRQGPAAFGPSFVEAMEDHRRRQALAEYLVAPGVTAELVAHRAGVTPEEIEAMVSGEAMVGDGVLHEGRYVAGSPVFAAGQIKVPEGGGGGPRRGRRP